MYRFENNFFFLTFKRWIEMNLVILLLWIHQIFWIRICVQIIRIHMTGFYDLLSMNFEQFS